MCASVYSPYKFTAFLPSVTQGVPRGREKRSAAGFAFVRRYCITKSKARKLHICGNFILFRDLRAAARHPRRTRACIGSFRRPPRSRSTAAGRGPSRRRIRSPPRCARSASPPRRRAEREGHAGHGADASRRPARVEHKAVVFELERIGGEVRRHAREQLRREDGDLVSSASASKRSV